MRTLLLLALCLLAACLQPVTQPQPAQLATSLTPTDVVRLVSSDLTANGFEVTTVDANTGIVSARRIRSASAQGTDVKCRFGPGSLNDSRLPVTLGISVSARSVETKTQVIVSSHTTMKSNVDGSDSDIDCASSGEVERRIASLVSR